VTVQVREVNGPQRPLLPTYANSALTWRIQGAASED
jgi:hypothetical protein